MKTAPVATVAAQVGETKLDVARLQSQLQGELQRTLDVAAPAATIGKSSRAAPRPDPLGALLGPLAGRLAASRANDPVQRAHDRWLGELLNDRERLEALLDRRQIQTPTPPGSPIGTEQDWGA